MQRARTGIVSHRGGSLLWPENSIEAFRNSLRIGVDAVECDVHLSADQVPMVIHDATLERTTEETGLVSGRSAEALGRVRLLGHDDATVPRLAEVAALLRGGTQVLQVEIKGHGRFDLLDRSLAALDAAAIRPQASIIAFDPAIAAAAVSAGGLAQVVWLIDAALLRRVGTAEIIALASAHAVRAVETEIGVMDAGLFEAFREAGLTTGVWGANDAPSLCKAFDLGLDLVATDDPVLALRLRPG